MSAALAEARRRTFAHVRLPGGERFTVSYVTEKPWGAYNWYQGGGVSLIEVNVSRPLSALHPLELAAHEGYPGHHVLNTLREERLVKGRGWIQFTVLPLFVPDAIVAEGSAEYGAELAFPREGRVAFLRDVGLPAAGPEPAGAERYVEIADLLKELCRHRSSGVPFPPESPEPGSVSSGAGSIIPSAQTVRSQPEMSASVSWQAMQCASMRLSRSFTTQISPRH